MSANTPVSVVSCPMDIQGKRAVITATLSASYDTGGSLIDLSSANAIMLAGNGGFVTVSGVEMVGVSPHASDKYRIAFIPGAALGPALGKLKIRDLSAASDAEVSSTTDLSATTVTLVVYGT